MPVAGGGAAPPSDTTGMHVATLPAPTALTLRLPEATVAGCLNCLSVDVEEYFQCEVFRRCVSRAEWTTYERRARPALEQSAGWLADSRSHATFYVLGWNVPHLAPLLRDLARAGHEIACHGDGHEHLARLDSQQLREDLRRARGQLEDLVGVRPRGYRAPTFSVTRATAWALDVILDAGFDYDASIFPIRHDRYGVPDAPVGPFWAVTPSGRRLLEFPPLTLAWGPLRVPVGGGGYLRLLPAGWLRRCIRARQRRLGGPTPGAAAVMIYVHPWEFDPDQPRLPVGRLAQWRHRVNLHTTADKLRRLLAEFRFDTAAAVLQRVRVLGDLPEFALAPDGAPDSPPC